MVPKYVFLAPLICRRAKEGVTGYSALKGSLAAVHVPIEGIRTPHITGSLHEVFVKHLLCMSKTPH